MDRIQSSRLRALRKDALGTEMRDPVGFRFLIYIEDIYRYTDSWAERNIKDDSRAFGISKELSSTLDIIGDGVIIGPH